jgi:ElaB/YqjD/DUF883 family membrane-anchored ribosome-binding protein
MSDMSNASRDKGQFKGSGQNRGPHGGTSTMDRPQSGSQNLGSQAKDAASSAVSSVKQAAQETASQIGQKAEGAATSLGQGTIRETGPRDGMLGTAATELANCMETSGKYLEQHDLTRMTEDLTGLVRRYPIQGVLVGIGVGFLVGCCTRS